MRKVCIIGGSGKLGRHLIAHCLERGYDVTAVCRPESVGKLADLADRIAVVPGRTDDREVVARAVTGCDGVLVVLVPFGVRGYSSGTARAVLDHAEPGARLVFSCGWHITRDGRDRYTRRFRLMVRAMTVAARAIRFADIDDQVRACELIFASDAAWTVVRGSDLAEGPSEGLPVWARHVGDPVLASNLTMRTDYALFMVAALTDDDLVHEAPAIVGRGTPSARAHAGAA